MIKNIHRLLIALTTVLLSEVLYAQTPSNGEQLFYYSFDKKVLIEEVPGRFMIKKKSDVSKEGLESIVQSYLENTEFDWFNSDICTVSTDNQLLVDRAIKKMLNEDAVLSARHVYNTSAGKKYYNNHPWGEPLALGLIDQIVLKYKEGVEQSIKDNLKKAFGLTEYDKNELFDIYLVPKEEDIIGLSLKLFETGYFVYAYPELISKSTFYDEWAVYPNDPYFQYQVTLHNTGQFFNGHFGLTDADIDAPEAWALTMGSENVIVAVIDNGVTSNHPDLPNTRQVRLNGSNFGSGNSNDPSPIGNDNHGNACAGVIAATANNEEGIAGIAPLCKIMPVRIEDNTTPHDKALAIHFAANNGAKIISNSWGYGDTTSLLYPCIIDAITSSVNKGCLVLFAAGNYARNHVNYNGYVGFPANRTSFINGMLSVGASDRNDQQADYSPKSQLIDIVAPSNKAFPPHPNGTPGIQGENMDMWTIDIPGSNGYNPWNTDQGSDFTSGETLPTSGTNYLSYTGHFGGTSHSCPVVAGVAALLLSMNPYLTPQDLCNILTTTADKTGGYTYVNGKCDEMGYGRVNAMNAVWMVCDTTKVVGQPIHYVSGLEEYHGCDVYIKDVQVNSNNAILKIRARNNAIIDGEFFINTGSVLDIKPDY